MHMSFKNSFYTLFTNVIVLGDKAFSWWLSHRCFVFKNVIHVHIKTTLLLSTDLLHVRDALETERQLVAYAKSSDSLTLGILVSKIMGNTLIPAINCPTCGILIYSNRNELHRESKSIV